jgi:hypothetical protein
MHYWSFNSVLISSAVQSNVLVITKMFLQLLQKCLYQSLSFIRSNIRPLCSLSSFTALHTRLVRTWGTRHRILLLRLDSCRPTLYSNPCWTFFLKLLMNFRSAHVFLDADTPLTPTYMCTHMKWLSSSLCFRKQYRCLLLLCSDRAHVCII